MPVDTPPPAEALLRQFPDPVVFLDFAGTIVEATERIEQIGGWQRHELVGRSCLELFPPDVRTEVDRAFQEWVRSGHSPIERRGLRLPVLAADGSSVEVELRVDRTSTGFVATVHDVGADGNDLRSHLLEAMSAPAVDGTLLADLAARLGTGFRWDRVAIWVIDDRSGSMRAVAVWQAAPDADPDYRRLTLDTTLVAGQGLPGMAWADDAVQRVDDLSEHPGADLRLASTRASAVFAPVRVGSRPIGVLELVAADRVHTGLWLVSELEAVSSALGHVLGRFRDRLHADVLGGRLALALDAGRLGIWTLDVRSGVAEWSVRFSELHGLGAEPGAGGPDTAFVHVIDDDRVLLGEAVERSRASSEPVTVEYRVASHAGDPRWVSSRLSRILNNGGPTILSAVAADVTARKQDEIAARRRTAAVEGLQWVSRAIISGRALHDTAAAVADAATGVLGADLGVVLFPEPGEVADRLAWAVSGLGGDDVPPPPQNLGLPSVVDGPVVNVSDLGRAPEVAQFIDELGLGDGRRRSALLVPVRGAGGRSLGLMVFTSAERAYFTEDDATMAASIGSSTGVAIENAHRHEQQRLAAMAFQRQLLPRESPEVDGVELCVRYHPGRDGLDVGGDWYDVIDLGSGRLGVSVGDVCGHGLRAAACMGQFRYSFRALLQSGSSPADAFAVVNRLALTELDTTATMAYVELDTRSGSCALWNCGHLPPIIAASEDEPVRWLEDAATRGPMLGFLDHIEVAPLRTSLDPGEILLLYTDGLVERRGEHIDDGLQRLAQAFRQRPPVLDDLCDQLHVDLATMGPDADDTVLLAVRRS